MPRSRISTGYNEPSWAIDVISEINAFIAPRAGNIRRAGGERTLFAAHRRLFPDVMLFGDALSGRILQGWELKMPDTPITDQELLANAEDKANHLGLNSFVVWNVVTAQLFVRDAAGAFAPAHTWRSLPQITGRGEVEPHRADWIALLHEIIETLEDFFERGTLLPQTVAAALSGGTLVDIILANKGAVAATLQRHAARSGRLAAEAELWWAANKAEYRGEEKWAALARVNLVNWLNRFLFAHYLKRFAAGARQIDTLRAGTSLDDGRRIFEDITRQCDFLNVFVPSVGVAVIDAVTWSCLLQFNEFLSELRLEAIDQEILQEILERVIATSRRKAAGQYITPRELADLLVRVTMTDKESSFIDAFCGTGTIARAALDLKMEFGISLARALNAVWASDKFSFPLQVTTLALSRPESVNQILHVFRADALDLRIGNQIDLINPTNGSPVLAALPSFQCSASNFPFVRFEDVSAANPHVSDINGFITEHVTGGNALTSKSDLFAYLPFAMWRLLNDGGRLGIIVSNAWLGTEWGQVFRDLLARFYRIETVITSGRGRWFANSDVVTNILVLTKRDPPAAPVDEEAISFAILNRPIEELENHDISRRIASRVVLGRPDVADIEIRRFARRDIDELKNIGLEWNACFADLAWTRRLAGGVVPVHSLFEINRGERRGWDPLFLPVGNHGIERTYLRPILKSSQHLDGLIAETDGDAFCCSASLAELRRRGHNGALRWIRRFQREVNEKGRPLPDVLARSKHHWYEMRDDTVADLVALINYGERLFVARMSQRAFVNQRLIRLTKRDSTLDISLCHALLNSLLGLFYLEALGFGRGLGALDLNATKLRNRLFMLDPTRLAAAQAREIKTRFGHILNRPVESITDELAREDRRAFDIAVLEAFGLGDIRSDLERSLLTLFRIRMAALQ